MLYFYSMAMDPQKALEKILKEKDPMKCIAWCDYSIESKILVKELQYVRSVKKITMILYTIFSKNWGKQAYISWQPIAEAIFKDADLSKHVGRLIKK